MKALDDSFVLNVLNVLSGWQILQATDETVDQVVCTLRQRAACFDSGEYHR